MTARNRDKADKYYRLGLTGFAVTIVLISVMNIAFDLNVLKADSLTTYLFVIPGNIGLVLFFGCGIYLWLHYYQAVKKSYSTYVLLNYLAFNAFAGYWAHYHFKNSDNVSEYM